MRNPSPTSSTIPVRGAIGLALTLGSLALLFSFRSPEPVQLETSVRQDPGVRVASELQATEVPGPARVIGEAVSTRWGDVQVVVDADRGDIVSVQAVSLPARDGRSRQLSARAEPVLRMQAIVTDSADIDVVSGATYTSHAYASSLQSALDQLGI
jgi:uncharacterized protein with FMN-binding domain